MYGQAHILPYPPVLYGQLNPSGSLILVNPSNPSNPNKVAKCHTQSSRQRQAQRFSYFRINERIDSTVGNTYNLRP